MVRVYKKEMLEEHKKLVKILQSGSKTQRAKEAKRQSKELKQFK